MKTLRFILVLVCCVGLVDGLALAQGKKKKRKKRKPVATEQSEQGAVPAEQGEAVAAVESTGDGSHGAQDKPGPYNHELGMTFNFASNSSTETENDVESDGPSITSINLDARYHYLLGQMGPGTLGVGPLLSIKNKSEEQEGPTGTSEQTEMEIKIGGSAIYYLGDIQTQPLVWFVGANAGYASASSATNGNDNPGVSGFGLGMDGGGYYFLDAGVAIRAGAYFNYNLGTVEAPATGGNEKDYTSMEFGLLVGLSSFF